MLTVPTIDFDCAEDDPGECGLYCDIVTYSLRNTIGAHVNADEKSMTLLWLSLFDRAGQRQHQMDIWAHTVAGGCAMLAIGEVRGNTEAGVRYAREHG